MLTRMGIGSTPGQPPDPEAMRKAAEALRRFPDLDLTFEMMLRRMIGLLFIEVSAFHTFAWAEVVLSDTDLVAGDGEAAALVRCIRTDEKPHVDYLRTTLTEIRDRTLIGDSGRTIPGAEVIGTLWTAALEQSLGANRENMRKTVVAELEHTLAGKANRSEILEGFNALGHAAEREGVA